MNIRDILTSGKFVVVVSDAPSNDTAARDILRVDFLALKNSPTALRETSVLLQGHPRVVSFSAVGSDDTEPVTSAFFKQSPKGFKAKGWADDLDAAIQKSPGILAYASAKVNKPGEGGDLYWLLCGLRNNKIVKEVEILINGSTKAVSAKVHTVSKKYVPEVDADPDLNESRNKGVAANSKVQKGPKSEISGTDKVSTAPYIAKPMQAGIGVAALGALALNTVFSKDKKDNEGQITLRSIPDDDNRPVNKSKRRANQAEEDAFFNM